MTEQELAKQLFTRDQELSSSAASIMTGTALGDSSDGSVRIQVDGAQVGGDNQGVILPTTIPVSSGQKVVITLYGRSGGGKKGMVTGIVGGSGGGGGDISQLEARVSALERTTSSLSTSVSSLQTRVNALDTTVSSHTSSISSLQGRMTSAEGSISTLRSDVSSLQSDMMTAQSDINTIQSEVDTIQSDIADAQSDISSLQSSLSSLSSTVSGHTTSISSLQSRMTSAERTITNLSSDVSIIQSDIVAIQSMVDDHDNTISSLQSRMTSAEGDISDLDDRVTALEQGGSLPALEQRVGSLETRMTTAEGDIDSLQSDMTTAQSDIRTHASKINELVSVENRRGFERLYTWTGTGALSSCKASLWYQPLSGLVVVPIYISGTPGTGWLSIGSGIPSALRPGQLTGASDVNYAQTMFSQSIGGYVSGGGYVGIRSSYSGSTTERGYLVYLAKGDQLYTSTVSTVSSSISPLTITRAYAARVALGDGLDVQSEEFEKTAEIYSDAYDVIFGDDNANEGTE